MLELFMQSALYDDSSIEWVLSRPLSVGYSISKAFNINNTTLESLETWDEVKANAEAVNAITANEEANIRLARFISGNEAGATATASDIVSGKTAYANDGTLITGTGDVNLVPENIKAGVTIMGVTGTYEPPVGQDDAIIEDIAEVKTVVDTINTNTASSGGGLKSVTKSYSGITYTATTASGLTQSQIGGLYCIYVNGTCGSGSDTYTINRYKYINAKSGTTNTYGTESITFPGVYNSDNTSVATNMLEYTVDSSKLLGQRNYPFTGSITYYYF